MAANQFVAVGVQLDSTIDLLFALNDNVRKDAIRSGLECRLRDTLRTLNVHYSNSRIATRIEKLTMEISDLEARQNFSGDTNNIDPKLLRIVDETAEQLVSGWRIREVDEAHVEFGRNATNAQFTMTISLFAR